MATNNTDTAFGLKTTTTPHNHAPQQNITFSYSYSGAIDSLKLTHTVKININYEKTKGII